MVLSWYNCVVEVCFAEFSVTITKHPFFCFALRAGFDNQQKTGVVF